MWSSVVERGRACSGEARLEGPGSSVRRVSSKYGLVVLAGRKLSESGGSWELYDPRTCQLCGTCQFRKPCVRCKAACR